MMKKAVLALLMLTVWSISGCGAKDGGGLQSGTPAAQAPALGTPSPAVTEPSGPTPTVSLEADEKQLVDSFISEAAPDFTLEKADGEKVTLGELRGKPVVLNFWATWCPYCVMEFPYFSQAQKDFPEIVFLGIDTKENTDLADRANRENIAKFAEENGFEIPILFDVGNKLGDGAYATQGLPSTFFIDSKGNIRLYVPGAFPDYKMLKSFLTAFWKADRLNL